MMVAGRQLEERMTSYMTELVAPRVHPTHTHTLS